MITLIRLEAEGFNLDEVVKDLDAMEAAVMALQSDEKGPVPGNTGVTDEHYERVQNAKAAAGHQSYFKGRRVLKFLGRAAWDDNSDIEKPQPRLAASMPFIGTTSTNPPAPATITFAPGGSISAN